MNAPDSRGPRLSLVLWSRNDNHGGAALPRMQASLECTVGLLAKYRVPSEFILVEYNPPEDAASLVEAVKWPAAQDYCSIRVIQVPPEVHRRFPGGEGRRILTALANNIGVRRARGDFILNTTMDHLYSDELIRRLAERPLDPWCLYRIPRYDIDRRVLEVDGWPARLQYCPSHVLRRYGLLPLNLGPGRPNLFTNACGDFQLLSRRAWHALHGFREADVAGMHIDSLLSYAAFALGIKEHVWEDLKLYHIDHDAGSQQSLKTRVTESGEKEFIRNGVKVHDWEYYADFIRGLVLGKVNPIFNDDGWGAAGEDLPEIQIHQAAWSRGVEANGGEARPGETVEPGPRIDPRYQVGLALFREAKSSLARGRAEEALALLDQSLDLTKGLGVHKLNLERAAALASLGRLREAHAAIVAEKEFEPANPKVLEFEKKLVEELSRTTAFQFSPSPAAPEKAATESVPEETPPVTSEKEKPYLSVVVTARNDNHGGDLLRRMKIFVDGLIAQLDRRHIASELILVEWNPPEDRPRLTAALAWPKSVCCDIRIVEASHEIHRRFKHGEHLPLYQMIAKNVGIRRAKGDFILATNVDILLNDELMDYIAAGKLEKGKIYRIDRYDVRSDVPDGRPVQEQLEFCRNNVIRVCERYGIRDFTQGRFHLHSLTPEMQREKGLPISIPLHTNGCGDFTLMSGPDWSGLRGYPEFDMFSMHLDSILCHQANLSGISEVFLEDPRRIYHIEHGSGFTPESHQSGSLYQRLEENGVPYLDNSKLRGLLERIRTNPKAIPINGAGWGIAGEALPETVRAADGPPSRTGPGAAQRQAEALVQSARALAAAGDRHGALAQFDQAIQLMGQFNLKAQGVHFMIAQVLVDIGRSDVAAKALQAELATFPDFKEARDMLAALTRGPGLSSDIDRKIKLGEELVRQGRLREAETTLSQALGEAPDNLNVRNGLAVLRWAQDRRQDAVALLREILGQEPWHRAANWNLGRFLREAGLEPDARQVYQAYIHHHPDEKGMAEMLREWDLSGDK
ncbi:MAG: tetratricopeptide repeat protein [Pseudomonadota bacterium]